MSEKHELSKEEMVERSSKFDQILSDNSEPVLKEIAKLVGRDLTDEEKKDLTNQFKAFFLISSLMVQATLK